MNDHDHQRLRTEGYEVRPGSISDVRAATELTNICSRHHLGVSEALLDSMRREWTAPGFDLEGSTRLVLTPEGELVGLMEVWDVHEPPVHPYIWWRIHPNQDSEQLADALLGWAIDRARQVLARVPEEARVSIYTDVFNAYHRGKLHLARRGFELIRHSWQMVIDLDGPPAEPRWPEGISLDRYRHPEDAKRLYAAEDEAFRDHFGYVEASFEHGFQRWFYHATAGENFDPELWFMAMDGDQIAGVVRGRPYRDEDRAMGWVGALSVRRPWRGRGLGLALLQHLFNIFYRRGKSRVGLGVDASNMTGATNLYRKAGMHVDRQYDRYERVLREGVELATTDQQGDG